MRGREGGRGEEGGRVYEREGGREVEEREGGRCLTTIVQKNSFQNIQIQRYPRHQ
jgi:hypothetical protein